MAQGTLKRSSLNEFVEAIRDGSAQLQESLNRAAGLIQSLSRWRRIAIIRICAPSTSAI